ncbi:transposase [Enterococcus casseliflavus]|uniref:transposase n=1 Tax=Enterococcus casseliflavus TaxID=37734 RepID=UPI00403C2C36
MSKKSLYSPEEKYQVISEVMNGRHSLNSIAKKHSLSWMTIKDWIRKYNDDGIEGQKKSTTWKRYTSDLKRNAVLAVINEELSLWQATAVFQLSSTTILRKWISSYTNEEMVKSTSKGSVPKTRINGRKTTYQERIEIVQYIIQSLTS